MSTQDLTVTVPSYNVEVTQGVGSFSVTPPEYNIEVTVISGVAAGGGDNNLKKQEVSGTIDGANTAFTVPSSFSGKSFIILGQTILIEDEHYTVSGTGITYNDPPPAGQSGKAHYLYHG